MIIQIKKDNNPPEILKRKTKMKKIFGDEENEIDILSKYDWKLKGENKYESIEDFHLFCVSITKDLLSDIFKTNERGSLIYDLPEFDEEEKKVIIKSLKLLYKKIGNIKFEKDKKLREKL